MLLEFQYTDDMEKVTIRDQLDEYKRILKVHSTVHLVMVLHSIDGPNLKNPESQERLAELIDNPQIQLICSLDDMKTVFNWSSSKLTLIQLLFKSSNFSSSISIPLSLTPKSSSFAL